MPGSATHFEHEAHTLLRALLAARKRLPRECSNAVQDDVLSGRCHRPWEEERAEGISSRGAGGGLISGSGPG